MCIIQSIHTQDSCPTWKKKTFLDETTGTDEDSSINYIPVLNFYKKWSHMVWRKVLIQSRIEVNLKTGIKAIDIIENGKELNIKGIKIVISKKKNKLSSNSNIILDIMDPQKVILLNLISIKTFTPRW